MKQVIGMLVFCLVGLVAASVVMAQETKAEAKAVEVAGVVAVQKDDAGAVTAITVTTAAKEVVAVNLDVQGKKVAANDKKNVKITGTVEEKDGKKTVTVQKCVVVEEKKVTE